MTELTGTPTAIVIGGGAAGFFAAINLARQSPNLQVTLLEAGAQFLSKVRISGGGRCNVTHQCFDPAQLAQNYPRGGKALRGAFSRFQPQDTIAWFGAAGVDLKTEADGRMFPVTDDSGTIVDCLLNAARQVGVKLRSQAPVREITKTDQKFLVTLKSGEMLQGNRLIIATGSHSLGHRWARALGHTIQPPVPSLFTFNIGDRDLRQLAGVSVPKAQVSLTDKKSKGALSQTGPLLITHWGLSGPAVLKLSAWGARELHDSHYHHPLWINWLPDCSPADAVAQLQTLKQSHARKQIQTFSTLPIPKRLWRYLVARAGIGETQAWADFSKVQCQTLSQLLSHSRYDITGKGVFKEEFVTCGGISLKEIDFKTMESRCCPGLYWAGEVLDVDGITGGFNFQNAWTTGWLAAQGCAASLNLS